MTRQRSDEWRKQQIRAAATRCFVRRGFSATRLLDIAREAGLSKGGVYFHYRAKEALFHDILDSQVRTLESRWSFQPILDQPADTTLARLIVAHLRTMEDEPDETRLTHLLVSMAAQDPTFRDKLDEAFRLIRTLYRGVIVRGIAENIFRAGNPEQMACCILALVQGMACQCATCPEGKLPFRPELVADQALAMLRPSTRLGSAAGAGAAIHMQS